MYETKYDAIHRQKKKKLWLDEFRLTPIFLMDSVVSGSENLRVEASVRKANCFQSLNSVKGDRFCIDVLLFYIWPAPDGNDKIMKGGTTWERREGLVAVRVLPYIS